MRWIIIGRDADPVVREVLEELAEEVLQADEPADAVDQCTRVPCDGAVLLGCPKDELAREQLLRLRQGPNGDRMAILAVVDRDHLPHVTGIPPVELFEVLARPVDPAELRTRLRLLLHRSRKRAPAEEEGWRQRFEAMEQRLLVGSWDWDVRTGRMRFSAQACRNLALDPQSQPETYEAFLAHVHPHDQEEIRRLTEVVFRTHREVDAHYRVIDPDGSIRWIHARGRPELDSGGEVVRIHGTTQDVTRQRRLEEELQEAQKMESVGRLAGGVAHDFNNLLTTILGNVELLAGRFGDMESLAHVREAAERAASLTSQLLAFSRRQVLRPRLTDLGEAVGQWETLLRRLIGEDVEVTFERAPDLWNTRVDPRQLQQVLLNLAVNARDAMPTGGRLVVRTGNATLTGPLPRDVHPGDYVTLEVSDTGEGMDRTTMARIFEPFFTTKGPGRGTGLGLSTVFGIVKQSGGHVEVDSEVGLGTTFRIYLPRSRAESEARPHARATPQADAPGGRILLVEDELLVRNLARRVLEQAGYTVLQADDAEMALRLWSDSRDRISLLVTDVIMPGLSGPALASRLLDEAPHLPVLYISGYTPEGVRERGLLEGEAAFLQKPFSSEALLGKVREVLRHAAGASSAAEAEDAASA